MLFPVDPQGIVNDSLAGLICPPNVCKMEHGPVPCNPGDLGPLEGAPGLPFPESNVHGDPNFPPPSKKPKSGFKNVWERIKYFVKEGVKRLPWILNPPN